MEDEKEIHICEQCGNEHDGSYGSGRFCSYLCKMHYISAQSAKSRKTTKFPRIKGRLPYGTWKCNKCNLIFETKQYLKEHNHQKHPIPKGSSWNKGLTKETDERVKLSGKTYSDRVKTGQIIPVWKGKHLSKEHKKKCSIATCKYLIKTHGGPRYNKSAIHILEQIAKEHGWNIQHAENGGEFYTGIGYFVDAYDKEQNVVLEYDEPAHYEDVENNILREKDLKRQNEIIEHLHCEYWRYNEKMKVLWKVE